MILLPELFQNRVFGLYRRSGLVTLANDTAAFAKARVPEQREHGFGVGDGYGGGHFARVLQLVTHHRNEPVLGQGTADDDAQIPVGSGNPYETQQAARDPSYLAEAGQNVDDHVGPLECQHDLSERCGTAKAIVQPLEHQAIGCAHALKSGLRRSSPSESRGAACERDGERPCSKHGLSIRRRDTDRQATKGGVLAMPRFAACCQRVLQLEGETVVAGERYDSTALGRVDRMQ